MSSPLEQPVPFINIPLWQLIIIGAVVFIIYLLLTRKTRSKQYKPINLKEEIKKELKVQYKYFASPVHKPIYSGLVRIGYAIGYMPLVWNKRLKVIENIYKNKKKVKEGYEEKEANAPAGKDYMVTDNPDVIKYEEGETRLKKGVKIEDEPIPMFCFKICGDSFFNKSLAKIFGSGITYFLIEEKDCIIMEQSIQFNSGLQRQFFFGNFIFSKASKNVIDNTSFRIDRENQLQEIANQIPRTVFFANEFAQRAMAMREQAEIEAKKFSAQKESQQD